MKNKELLVQLEAIFSDVLENDSLVLTNETCADDISEWDSLSHLILVAEIEKAFGIRFSSVEMLQWKNVGDICDSIQKHISEI